MNGSLRMVTSFGLGSLDICPPDERHRVDETIVQELLVKLVESLLHSLLARDLRGINEFLASDIRLLAIVTIDRSTDCLPKKEVRECGCGGEGGECGHHRARLGERIRIVPADETKR
ncbi:hypothetical protein BLNAU_9819 [Blattamonas nauphoetae]|uniref:Uncharacterized protein n=1 Tax=Blattamonas nauphoetae TaxID=2049346 RepID=A0ABQ9XUV7_9EUKA|nr:hypothetical protein BLNAU_9819 [Blattamonas nauphoetae]